MQNGHLDMIGIFLSRVYGKPDYWVDDYPYSLHFHTLEHLNPQTLPRYLTI